MNGAKEQDGRALVVAPSWIGDAVLSQPLLARLAAQRPESAIDVFAPKWVLPVYVRMPEVARTIENPFGHGQLALGQRRRVGRALAQNGYSHAYVLPNSLKSALVPWFAGIARRVGYIGEMRYLLLNDRRPLDKQRLPLMVERFAWLAQPATSELDRPVAHPRLHVAANEFSETCQHLELGSPRRLACFCPGAEFGPAKRWPAGHFADLAKRLADKGYAVWLLGSAADKPVGDEIARSSGGSAINLCGTTSLDQAVVLLSGAHLVVTNDSGLMHVAAALERPTIAIYGSSSPSFTPPLSDVARVVKLDLPCSPCFARTCPLKHFDCMVKLDTATVMQQVVALEQDSTERNS
ncbi:MAG: lipopolysaccharide heptosyltransferase II [Betaproteobacteria bacterium]|nr:MAG: lipopolysaccharide heptosyltransferase II [Betaproteobacteria bacterium]